PILYAADFHNARVLMINGQWQDVTPAGAFVDPDLPNGYAPFGIQAIGDRIYVGYAQQDANAEDEIAGMSRGFVDAYDLSGNLIARVATRGQLDAPWGLALAPASFERFAGDLLVGNFGNGQINAYTNASGVWEYDGALRNVDGKKLAIDGLWALEFGNAGNNGNPNTLFFTAGPDDESQGLFGTILPSCPHLAGDGSHEAPRPPRERGGLGVLDALTHGADRGSPRPRRRRRRRHVGVELRSGSAASAPARRSCN